MKIVRTIIGFLLLSLLVACVASIHPLYTKQELVQNDELVGTWKTDKELWTFKKDKALPNGYRLVHLTNNNLSFFDAHLVQLGDQLYLNIHPSTKGESDANYLKEKHQLHLHSFSKITIEENIIAISTLDGGLLEKKLKDQTINLTHFFTPDEYLVLTANTKALQSFVVQNDDLFRTSFKLTKVPASL